MSGNECFIHIGTHKTGTTSFQQFLYDNMQALLFQGVDPLADFERAPPIGPKAFNVRNIAHLFIRPELLTGPRLRGRTPMLDDEHKRLFEDALVERINRSLFPKIIASAEAFCFLRTDQERQHMSAFLSRLNRRVRFFVVFRDDESWRQSWIKQVNKGAALRALHGFSNADTPDLIADWYFDKRAIRSFWSSIGELVELDYAEHADVRHGLARCMGVATQGLVFGPWQNVSLPDQVQR